VAVNPAKVLDWSAKEGSLITLMYAENRKLFYFLSGLLYNLAIQGNGGDLDQGDVIVDCGWVVLSMDNFGGGGSGHAVPFGGQLPVLATKLHNDLVFAVKH